MTSLHALVLRFFERVVIKRPIPVLLCLLIILSFLAYYAKDFRLDASAETLMLQNDKALAFSRMVADRYQVKDFLVVTVTPRGDLFSDAELKRLAGLQSELTAVPGVASIFSILDAPLLQSPPVPLRDLTKNIRTLQSPKVDRKLARVEFQTSPLYRNLIVSPDLKSTALILYLRTDKRYQRLLDRRNALRSKRETIGLTADEGERYKAVQAEFRRYHDRMRKERHQTILAIRRIMSRYQDHAKLFLGGVSMIADDMISFIKRDLETFGVGIFLFLIITLWVIFRRLRWVLLPMLCCILSALAMIGILGFFGWEVTVISSNFISLQLIIAMAGTIHLVVRYRELRQKNPAASQQELALETVRLKLVPCLYASLTTIAGFGSLLFCNILPVITFGWMMTAGICLSLVLTFLLFPAVLVLLEKGPEEKATTGKAAVVRLLAVFTERNGTLIIALSALLLILSGIGISKLRVENSFIDYFKKSTEIYKGMRVIDQHLGGTTPLDVIIDLGPGTPDSKTAKNVTEGGAGAKQDVFDEFNEFESPQNEKKYWLTQEKASLALRVTDYLESLKATGKVLSLGTLIKLARKINGGKPLDNFQLALLYNEMPEKYKTLLLSPYVSVAHNQLRFSVRVKDSEKSLRRNKFLKQIQNDIVNRFGLRQDQVHLAGMLVLYNNMLQSLFRSQILTLGIVLVALSLMFLILFRSLTIALIAIFPNILSVGVVLGVMGWLHIPLDMMTITIAAISVGIAVDDTIHYIHRFKEEFQADGNYRRAFRRCHDSIGHAMYYTSVTIIIGFAILVLSEFIPSIYFGLLTGLAMLIALIVALTLLPQLLILVKPYGPERNDGPGQRIPGDLR
jgi:hypothetical protein